MSSFTPHHTIQIYYVSLIESLPPSMFWWLNMIVWFVGTAVVVRKWLLPWTCWLGRLVLCWCRYAFFSHNCAGLRRYPQEKTLSACRCCGGLDFDGMAGRWAVVTGSTDGIGKEIAMQLTDRGMNVALVSRNLNKLEAVAQEIHVRQEGRIRTRVVVADFTSSAGTVSLSETYDVVSKGLADLDVAVLVNNAGMALSQISRFADISPRCSTATLKDGTVSPGRDIYRDIIECNALGPVAMSRIVIPMMMKSAHSGDGIYSRNRNQLHEKDLISTTPSSSLQAPPTWTRGGVIINISSVTALVLCPYICVYASTKAFMSKFSTELANEYGSHDEEKDDRPFLIAVRCLTPGFVATKMVRFVMNKTNIFFPDPETYVRHSLRSLNCHCGCRVVRKLYRGQTKNDCDKGVFGVRHGEKGGWLANVVSAVFDSPSSPFSPGRAGVSTTGYLPHTLMVRGINALQWILSESFISSLACRLMRSKRNHIAKAATLGRDKHVPGGRVNK